MENSTSHPVTIFCVSKALWFKKEVIDNDNSAKTNIRTVLEALQTITLSHVCTAEQWKNFFLYLQEPYLRTSRMFYISITVSLLR